ncbi:hypothetical protein JCM8208_000870 [Rhodotorula glutinis]
MAAVEQQPPAATATPARINATKPENLGASTKRTSKAQLLLQYQQLLPLEPAHHLGILDLILLSRRPLAPPRVDAVWDTLLQAVAVPDDNHMTRLWRQGFFGKGFLSRSEPSWRRRVDNRIAQHQGRTDKRLTPEEVTALRRIERKGTKLAKKLERDAERLVAASTATSQAGSPRPAPPTTLLPDLAPQLERVQEEHDVKGKGKGKEVVAASPADDVEADEQDPPPPAWHLDAEHSQLQPEEAFFLVFALDALHLTVSDPFADVDPASPTSSPPKKPLSILSAFRLFLEAACPSLVPLPSPLSLSPSPSSPASPSTYDPRLARLDSPFLVSYAAYHHFRSMGWVVRSGVKFCVDWVLYGQGGPVGGHAEFAVLVLPTYVDPADAASNPFRSHSALAVDRAGGATGDDEHRQGEGERKNSWRWFHTVNRVCSGVKKTLVLAHVVIPPLSSLPPQHSDPHWVVNHPAQALARLEVREVVVRRFLAGRMRD